MPEPRSLTERRKAATQLEIAQVAARLFADRGAAAVTAEAIAAEAGVSLRTFYRYSRTKEDAVAPLLAVGGDAWRARLAASDVGKGVLAAVEDAMRDALTAGADAGEDEFLRTRGLLRSVPGDPALADVWYRVNRESEQRLEPLLADLAPGEDRLERRLVAAAATDAIRLAMEEWAAGDAPVGGTGGPAALAVRCFRRLTGGR
ncbi:TetR/AcrR family transcriptional regulator [Isoptericola sp. NPDC057391]|uniref:TetR/AcrR family transcriptional regulator n=1 Tax=Isoptericola sp. NPDC057391 TaxID=3346117 RepID=UPI00363E50A8